MSLIINNLVWAKLEEVENIFWSKDFDLMEKVKNWIFDMFWENEVSRNFSNCLDKIVNWNKLTNEENSSMLYQNPSLEYIFDFWKIWKNLLEAWEEIDFWKNSEKIKTLINENSIKNFFIPENNGLRIIKNENLKNIYYHLENIEYKNIQIFVNNIKNCLENNLDLFIFSYEWFEIWGNQIEANKNNSWIIFWGIILVIIIFIFVLKNI